MKNPNNILSRPSSSHVSGKSTETANVLSVLQDTMCFSY